MYPAAIWMILCLVAAADLIISFFFFRRLLRIPTEVEDANAWLLNNPHASCPVSVVVCAHNEAESLQLNIPLILNQDYFLKDGSKAFELIVVNDSSSDESEILLESFKEKNPELRVIYISPDTVRTFPGKKYPLSLALDAAQYEWIVCIDADCSPASEKWLMLLNEKRDESTVIVAGYGAVRKTSGMLNWFAHYETMHTFLMYYSFTAAGMPYMAVGRNLMALKESYSFAQKQKAWSELPSGDDDLLVQLCATRDNMHVQASAQSFTWTKSKKSWKEYLAQKRRHVSTGKFYAAKTKFFLASYAILKSLCWLLLLLALIAHLPAAALLLLLVPFLGQAILFRKATAAMAESSSIPGWAAFFFCWMLYNALLAPYILWKSRQRWR